MMDVALCDCLAAKFDSCNSLISSVHTLLVNILQCVGLYIKRKYYYYIIIINIISHSKFMPKVVGWLGMWPKVVGWLGMWRTMASLGPRLYILAKTYWP